MHGTAILEEVVVHDQPCICGFFHALRTSTVAKENDYEAPEKPPIQGSSDEEEDLKKTPMTGTDRPCNM